jgi:hypothetical protein
VTCSVAPCFRGFEPWVQALLAFNVAFLALLFLVQAWLASRSSGEPDRFVDWLNRRPASWRAAGPLVRLAKC